MYMKNWLLLLMVMTTTCTVDIPLDMHGEWELSRLESVEEYGLYGLEFTTDTCFIVKEPNRIVVENKTLYGIVGSQIRTLYLIKK
mgnify:CR=1 FL=1